MKLSAIKGERTIEVIADIIEPIANIAADGNAAELFKRRKLPEGMTAGQFMTKRIRENAPALLKSHKGDIIAIMAAISDVTPEEYCKNLDLAKLIVDLIDLFTDGVFNELFISAQGGTEKTSFGSVPESTRA